MCGSTKSLDRSPSANNMGGTFIQWGPFTRSINGNMWWDTYAEGSYGFNDWVADPPPGRTEFWGLPSEWAVRNPYEEGASTIPMVFDSRWIDTAPKMVDNAPTDSENEMDLCPQSQWNKDALKFVCTDRHSGGVNVAFVDGNVRHVGVKELWLLKWHMTWIRTEPPNAWPNWTERYKDYPL